MIGYILTSSYELQKNAMHRLFNFLHLEGNEAHLIHI